MEGVMKKFFRIYAIMLLLCVVIGGSIIAYASDISDADFYGVVTVSNNSSTANYCIATTITGVNTSAFIAGDFLNSSANDCAIQFPGSDVPFMPGYANNPWVLWVPAIGGNGNIFDILYTKGVTGGEIYYFPGNNGANVSDDTSLELSNSGNLSFSAYMDTTSASGNYCYHYDTTYGGIIVTNNESGKVQAEFYNYNCLSFDGNDYARKAAGVVSPSGAEMSIETWVYFDSVAGTQGIISDGYTGAPTSYFALYIDASKLKFFAADSTAAGWAAGWASTNNTALGQWYHIMATYDKNAAPRVNVYVNGVTWGGADIGTGGDILQPNVNMYLGAFIAGTGHLTGDIDDARISDIARTQTEAINAYNGGRGRHLGPDGDTISYYSLDEGTGNPYDGAGNNDLTLGAGAATPTWVQTSPCTVAVASTSLLVTSDEHTTAVSYDSGVFALYVDASSNSTTLVGSYVADSTSPWYFGTENITPYIEYMEINVGGAQTGYWEWEYNDTFSDQSGNGNTMTPSFRTITSDSDVTALLSTFYPISEATAPAFAVGAGPDFLSTNITISGNFTTGNVSISYPGSDILVQLEAQTGVPYQIPSTFIATFLILVASMVTSYFLKSHAGMSLFIKSIVNTMGYGIAVALQIYDWWMLIFFFIFEVSFWFAAAERRQ